MSSLPLWYHGNISKNEAKILLSPRPFGTFLLRDSGNSDAAYTLSFRGADEVLHVRIYQSKGDDLYYLDAPKKKRQKFRSVVELIQFCMNLEKGMKAEKGSKNAKNQKETDDIFFLTEPLECLNNLNNFNEQNPPIINNNFVSGNNGNSTSASPATGLQLLKTVL